MALAELLMFFYMMGMITTGSKYWTVAFGREKGEVTSDSEGMEVAKVLAKRMAWLIKKLAT